MCYNGIGDPSNNVRVCTKGTRDSTRDPNSDIRVCTRPVSVILRATTISGTLDTMLGCILRLLLIILGTLIMMLTLY